MVDNSYQIFVNIDATALEGGNIYIGPAWSDPVTDRIPVFWDAGLTIPAEQPLRTSGGYIVRGGTPTEVFSNASTYSIAVNNARGQRIFYRPVAGGTLPASRVTFPIPAGPPGPRGPAGPPITEGIWDPDGTVIEEGIWS